ncbi:hypothetical protein POVCU2_0034890 [Plasmodium ovale curtisi]|uniref:Uncharacterized protein n=1 Tax=Plasmodium ovale curtisi TaxID=864141 RepID=A0A1A8VZK5_PLAOA|nr:hypothetical protein POVCU2_0034890 [Plasmodium ovale curtisi]
MNNRGKGMEKERGVFVCTHHMAHDTYMFGCMHEQCRDKNWGYTNVHYTVHSVSHAPVNVYHTNKGIDFSKELVIKVLDVPIGDVIFINRHEFQ